MIFNFFIFKNFYLWLNHVKREGKKKSLEQECIPAWYRRKDYLCLIHKEIVQDLVSLPSYVKIAPFVLPMLIQAYVTSCPSSSSTGGSFNPSLILEVFLRMLGSFICSWIHFYILTQSFSVCFKPKLILGMTQIFQMPGAGRWRIIST